MSTAAVLIGILRVEIYLLSFRHLLERWFLLGILFEMKIFCSDWPYLIRNHLSFLFLCFVLKYFTLKLKLRPKDGLTYAISIESDLLEFLSKKINFTFLCWIWIIDVSQQYCENFRKNWTSGMLKIWLEITYPTDFCMIWLHFYYGKMWNYWIF